MSVEDAAFNMRKTGHQHFLPVPYTFRVPDKHRKVGESSVLSPPNWLLLDHTIAVVWSLFSSFSPVKALDIDDLKWAHEYLKEVRNAKGENPPDVKTCLNQIQDRLIALYADLTHKDTDVKKKDESRQEDENDNKEIVLVVKASEEIAKVVKVPSGTKPKKESVSSVNRTAVVRKESTVSKRISLNQHKRGTGEASKSTTVGGKRSDGTRKENSKKEEEDTPVENYFLEVFHRNKTNDRILGSHNVGKKKGNAASGSTLSNEDISRSDVKKDSMQSRQDGKISLHFNKWITPEETNQNEEQAYRNLKNEVQNLTKNPKISKDEIVKFLCNWREEQMERLQSELKRLNSIEEIMKSFKMEGFVPYVPHDLTQQLESITCKKELSKPS